MHAAKSTKPMPAPTNAAKVSLPRPPMEHAAIMRSCYLDMILAGTKTIESRLSLTRGAPFGLVVPGDVVHFKDAGGEFRATARVCGVATFEDLRPADVRTLARRYRGAVGAPEEYWIERQHARYATLIWLSGVRACERAPLLRRKAGSRAAWFVLGNENARQREVA